MSTSGTENGGHRSAETTPLLRDEQNAEHQAPPTMLRASRFQPPIEIVMFFFMCAIYMGGPAGNELVQKLVCEEYRREGRTNSTDPGYCNTSQVTGAASDWLFWFNMAAVLPSFFVVAAFGALSDKVGRKPMMILPIWGAILQQGGILLVMYLDLAIPWLFLPMVMYGIFGTFALFFMALFSSIADTTSLKNRTLRITILEGMNLAGSCVGNVVGGQLAKHYGYACVFWVVGGIYVASLIYTLFLPETLTDEKRKRHISIWEMSIFGVLAILFRSWSIFLLALTFFLLLTTSVGYQIVILYLKHLFDWGDDLVGIFLSVTKACQGLSMILVLPLLVFFFGSKAKDYPLTQISILVMIVQYFLWAFFRQQDFMFGLTALGLLSGLSAPIVRSMTSKHVLPHEQGKLFAAIGAIETVTGLSGPAIFNHVYSATVHHFAQAFLYVAAGISIVCSLLLWAYVVVRRKAGNEQVQIIDTETEPAVIKDRTVSISKGELEP